MAPSKQDYINSALQHLKVARYDPETYHGYVQNGYPPGTGHAYNYKATHNYAAMQDLWKAAHMDATTTPPVPQPDPSPAFSPWQQLGAFVANADQVTGHHLDMFKSVGGKWVVVLLDQVGYPADHDPSCVRNRNEFAKLREWCKERGIRCGGWFNGWMGGELGNTPQQDADRIAFLCGTYGIDLLTLDLESPYKGDPHNLPQLMFETRARLPHADLSVSTNEPNNSMAWNGKNHYGDYRATPRALNIHILPQWYNSPNYGQGTWMQPDQTTAWIKDHGMEDNWYDSVPTSHRAIPLGFVHGTLEVTGLESADLAGELAAMNRAKAFGYTVGLSLYTLERTPDNDYNLLAGNRHLYLA